jgi:hypothetical protein
MKKELEAYDVQCAMFAEFCVPKCEAYGKDMGFCTEHKSCGRQPKLSDVMASYKR